MPVRQVVGYDKLYVAFAVGLTAFHWYTQYEQIANRDWMHWMVWALAMLVGYWLLDICQMKTKEVEAIRSLIPVCAWCRRIRTEEEEWVRFERYILETYGTESSHGICPKCNTIMMAEAEEL